MYIFSHFPCVFQDFQVSQDTWEPCLGCNTIWLCLMLHHNTMGCSIYVEQHSLDYVILCIGVRAQLIWKRKQRWSSI